MNANRSSLFSLSCLSALLFGAPLAAQDPDVRDLSVPTSWGYHYGVDAAAVTNLLNQGYRLTDIEIDSVSPLRFNTVYVHNSGEYQSGFWWYYGLTAQQLADNLTNNQARLIDLEAYDNGAGATRFACVMVPNTGLNQKSWWYYYGVQGNQISGFLSQHGARPVDIDSYEVNGNTYYDVVMIHNSGADQRSYNWFYNVSAQTIVNSTQNGFRVTDVERRDNGNFNAILVDDPAATPLWTWWYGQTAAQVADRLGQYGQRLIDIESYIVNNTRYFAIATINNKNALTTSVGQSMRATTDGTVGCYLKRINGSELAGLNDTRVFEPASTMKTLHHVHAFRQIATTPLSLQTPVNVFTAMNGSCPVDNTPVVEPMTTVLRQMMENSDNARTQAITAFFGENAINATASLLNMDDTDLNHRIGCAGDAIANPNEITLTDLGILHQAVANGYLMDLRDEFYEHMLNSLSWGGIDGVIDQEAAALVMPAPVKNAFKAAVQLARKGGSYTLISNNVTSEHRAGFGWIEIPFVQNQQVLPREYAVGAFVNGASNGTDAGNAITVAIGELLRPTLRAALETWDVSAIVQSFGAGCNGLSQSAIGLPRIGSSITLRATGGQPNTNTMLVIGFDDQFSGRTPLPLDLGFLGAPGCQALCDVAMTMSTTTSATGQASVTIALPANPTWLGVEAFSQFYVLGTPLSSSNGLRHVVGS